MELAKLPVTFVMSLYTITYIGLGAALIKQCVTSPGYHLTMTGYSALPVTNKAFKYSLSSSFLNILLFYCCMTNYSKTCHFKTTNIYYLTFCSPEIWVLLVQGLSQAIQVLSTIAAVSSRLRDQAGKILLQGHSHGCG